MSEGGCIDDATSLSLGQSLAQARAASGLSVADAARQLKLSPAQVMAMEADQHGQLPGPVFVRGFIRNYARLLGLDPEPLLAQIVESAPQSRRHEPKTPPAEIPLPTGRETRWHRYAIAVAALLIPAAIYQLSSDEAPQITVKPRPAASTEEPPVAMAPRESAAAHPENSPAPQGEKAEAVPATASPAASPSAAKPAAEHKPGAQRVVKLKFGEEAWAEVRDGSGRRILYQLNPAGSERAVTGAPPLLIVVGKAKSVRVTVDNEPVDLAPHTMTDVARLTVE